MKVKKTIRLLNVLSFLCLFFFPVSGHTETAKLQGEAEKSRIARPTEKGLFDVLMVIEGRELKVGENSLNLLIRDSGNRELTGAEITITPWMPAHGHGVWEKPVVTELGEGNYLVKNVVFIMSGNWDIRVAVKKGNEEDRAVFSFTVGTEAQTPQGNIEKQKGYQRKFSHYKIPDVTLLNQDGKRIRLRSLVDSGKPVIIDFIYTTCTTICPILSAGFSGLRDKLGMDSNAAQFVSISLDPEHDRPEKMKEYLARFNSGEGWDFLTGSREEIALVLNAFDASISDKMSHQPMYILRGPSSDEWVCITGMIGISDLMHEFRLIEK